MTMRVFTYIFIMFVVFSCNKTDIELAEHKQPQLSINGMLTNEMSNQIIHVEQSQNLNSKSPVYISNGNINVSLNNTISSYNYVSDGNYLSNTAYALIPDSNYTFKMTVLDSVYSCNFIMPTPITINSIIAEDNGFYKELTLYLSTTTSTGFKLNLFSGEIDTVTQDTLWQLKLLENTIYEANNSSINITDEVLEDKDSIIKIDIMSLDDVNAEYLKLLYQYRKNQSTTNQYINPPKGSFNNAFGLVYGSYISTYIKKI